MSTFTAQQKRRLAETSSAVQRVTDADAAYFERFPWRSHRIRYAARVELKANAAVLGVEKIDTEPGRRWFVAVRQIAPSVRTRLFVQNGDDCDPEMDEAEARAVYDWLARNGSSRALEIEAKLRRVVEQRGGR